jgi:hypothetical protein
MISASQRPNANEHSAAISMALKFTLFMLLAACSVSVAVAQVTKNCQCTFDTKDYDAYGTNGACGIFMYNKSHTCEISFSGVGASAKVLRKLLGDDAFKNQFTVAPQIFERYVTYERQGDVGGFLEPSFIKTSLVVLARAALFRESSESTQLPLKDIDGMFVDFSKKYSKAIAATFKGTDRPFTVDVEKKVVFSVGRGYVELNFHESATVRVVYFSEKPR